MKKRIFGLFLIALTVCALFPNAARAVSGESSMSYNLDDKEVPLYESDFQNGEYAIPLEDNPICTNLKMGHLKRTRFSSFFHAKMKRYGIEIEFLIIEAYNIRFEQEETHLCFPPQTPAGVRQKGKKSSRS